MLSFLKYSLYSPRYYERSIRLAVIYIAFYLRVPHVPELQFSVNRPYQFLIAGEPQQGRVSGVFNKEGAIFFWMSDLRRAQFTSFIM